MRFRRHFLCAFVLLGLIVFSRTLPVQAAGPISLTTLDSAYTQNFDTLAITGTTNTLLPTGWELTESGGGPRDNEQYAADNGGSNTGDTYSYGATSSGERAFGGLRSGNLIPIIGANFINNTGNVITSLKISYTGEEWRLGALSRNDQLDFQFSNDATSLTTGTWTDVNDLDFVTPTNTGTVGAKDGNASGFRTALDYTLGGLSIADGASFWIRWTDVNASGADDGLAVDDFSLTPKGPVGGTVLSVDDVAQNEGNAGTTSFNFTVSLSAPAGAGGVTFDIATADDTATQPSDYTLKTLTGQTIAQGNSTYNFTVDVNGDTTPEGDETFFVNVTNVSGATLGDSQGVGTILNDDLLKIHDVQGNGAVSPMVGSNVTVEGVVVASFQGSTQLKGFFLQEEDTDADADPLTAEGVFVYCNTCPTAVVEGQRVQVTGAVSEYFGLTEITASSASDVVVTDAGNNLAQVTAAAIDLPIVGSVDTYYEAREGMLVNFIDALSVSEYFELERYGQIVLTEGGRSFTFTEKNAPDGPGYAAHLDALAHRKIILDDDNNTQNAALSSPDGSQAIYHPRANGGFSVGVQGVDFFRGGDLVNDLTGVLDYSASAWRIRPTNAHPVAFTVNNARPAAPVINAAIKAVGMNLLNYFTTIDTTSGNTGPCGPSGTLDCRGADSAAERARQRERASIVICSLNADVYALVELENTTPSNTITDLLGAVNARCGGTQPYTFVNTGGTLGSDAIRVAIIYRSDVLSPIGSPLVDLDPIHSRPPTAQTFEVIKWSNPAYGERFTVIANHLKSKGCSNATGADLDQGDGQGCYADRRVQQATRLLTWINGTVIPAAGGDTDVLLLGDFNSYGQETPITTLTGGGYVDVESARLTDSYSYLFNGELGHLDYAFASASLNAKVQGIEVWHINADEASTLDYNDAIRDTGEAPFEEKPDGSALVPPRVVYEANSPYRASDHDPVIIGLFSPVPNAATMASFRAAYAPARQRILVKWETANELGVTGFNVWRQVGKREWVKVNAQPIAAKYAGAVSGGKYSFADKKIVAGKTYRYKLEILFADRPSEWSNVQRVATK
ncbi:MAG: hypothetical protein HDKAJFGB_03144 [Anaerolineae bacterium]|nr:hypothetical protein [Anaerolineae bacterium]